MWTEAELARDIFLRNHHHLISPWLFPKLERMERDRGFLFAGWARAQR